MKKKTNNFTKFVAPPSFLYKKNIRVYLTHMNQNQMNSFCQTFNFQTGSLFLSKNYGKRFGLSLVGFLVCKQFPFEKSDCIKNIKTDYLNKFLVIKCIKKSKINN